MLNLSEITPAWQALEHVLIPLETEEQHQKALEDLAPVWDVVGEDRAHPLFGLLQLMIGRIQTYEDRVYPVPQPSPPQMLAHLMEQRDLTQKALADATGLDQGNISKLLSGKRDFNLETVRLLSAYFGVEASLFIES